MMEALRDLVVNEEEHRTAVLVRPKVPIRQQALPPLI